MRRVNGERWLLGDPDTDTDFDVGVDTDVEQSLALQRRQAEVFRADCAYPTTPRDTLSTLSCRASMWVRSCMSDECCLEEQS